MLWILIAFTITLMVYYAIFKSRTYWTERGVQQKKSIPFFGDNFGMFMKKESFAEMVQSVYNQFPGARYSGIFQFSLPSLVVKDPELIKQIAVKDFDHFPDHRTFIPEDADPLFGKNLAALKGQTWRDMRATLSPSFTSSKMKMMFGLMTDAAQTFVNHFKNIEDDVIDIEMKDIFTRYTNDVIATTAFGVKVNSLGDKQNAFYLMGKEATDLTGIVKRFIFFGYFLIPKILTVFKVSLFGSKVSSFFRNIIKDTLKTREEQGIVRPDMLNLLIEARKGIHKQDDSSTIDTGFATVQESVLGKTKIQTNLSDDDITAQALIFFFAGFDAVSALMCFVSYELAVNSNIQDKLRDEIKDTLTECEGKITYETLMKMKYMDMVISESLRKWPNAAATDRLCVKPYIIKPQQPGEKPVHLTKNDLLMIPIWGIHRDPQYYPNPEKFDPERFSDENKNSIKPYTYLPFGVGPRNCIGSRFAILECKTILFYILNNFKLIPTKKSTIPLVLSKKGFNMTAENGFWFGLEKLRQ